MSTEDSDLADFQDFFAGVAGTQQEQVASVPAPVLEQMFDNEEDMADILRSDPLPPLVECTAPTAPITLDALTIFDPLAGESRITKQLLHRRIAKRLLQYGPFSLTGDLSPLKGVNGVYGLYYDGDKELWLPVRSPGATCKIYGGKNSEPSHGSSRDLRKRLEEHVESLKQSQLGPENFTFRFIPLEGGWIDFAEFALTREITQPIWNITRLGFGARCAATDTRGEDGQPSRFDTLYPGRIGAGKGYRAEPSDMEALIKKWMPVSVQAYETMMKLLAEPG